MSVTNAQEELEKVRLRPTRVTGLGLCAHLALNYEAHDLGIKVATAVCHVCGKRYQYSKSIGKFVKT